MKALVLEADSRLACRDVAMPERPAPGWLLLRIVSAGVCGSDLPRAFAGGAYRTPLIMGHEMAAVVEEPGEGFARGDLVAVYPLLPCRRCEACETGDFALCSHYDYFGSRRDGGFAEYLYAPEENLFAVPRGVDPMHAALTEPCAVALHAVRRLSVRPGGSAAVYGGGPVGNMVAQWLRVAGCRPVFVVDVERSKLDVAASMGFAPVDGGSVDPVEVIGEASGGGVEHVVEAVGLPLTFLQALRSARRGGQVVFLGNLSDELRIGTRDFSSVLRRELRIYGSWNSRMTPRGADDWSTVLGLLDREIDVGPLITHTPVLEEGPAILARMRDRSESFGRVVFRVGTAS